MTGQVRYEEGVEHDLVEARSWYERQRLNLGEQFLSAVWATFDRIAEMPLSYPRAHDEMRRARAWGFSYSVYFRLDGDIVVVLAVMHTSRHPDSWRSRG